MTTVASELTDFPSDTPVHPSQSVFERLRHSTPRVRPTWDQTWMQVAIAMAERAECTRSRVGAVIVVENRGVWVGYNGAPSGETHCTDGGCPRGRSGLPPGTEDPTYRNCVALHAEMNAIVKAGKEGRGGKLYCTRQPCDWCRKIAKAAGITRVYWLEEGDVIAHEDL